MYTTKYNAAYQKPIITSVCPAVGVEVADIIP
jgi:hypothetical protein